MDKENFNNPWISQQDLVGQLEPGDLIEFRRCALSGTQLYKHWGIYMGFRNGIHEIGHVTNGDKIDEKPKSSKKRNSFGLRFKRKKSISTC
uniref:LRAT domain-containing protein n=1 Tax=Strongyloides venezuelensis TaxID=75913 RepID=A0A0K0F4P4_STRVS